MNKINLLTQLIEKAKKLGATDADAIIIDSTAVNCEVRLGKLMSTERSENIAVALRVLINQQQAIVSTSSLDAKSIEAVAQKAVMMAKVTPANPHLFLATPTQITKDFMELDLYDSVEPTANDLIEKALEAENTALSNKLITNSEGAGASYSTNKVYFAASNGFHHHYQTSSNGLSLEVLAGKDNTMQTGGAYSVTRFAEDLKTPKELGILAAKRAIEKMNPRKIPSCEIPVIFDYRMARGVLGAFANAINGSSISRGTSFLIDHLNQDVFDSRITIIDDPFINRGLGSRPFDAEAILGQKLHIINEGKLNHYLLDLQTAHKLKMQTTGHATRGLSSAPTPSPTNLYMLPGETSLEDMIKSLKEGLFVTEVFGHGANIITGDYSQGVVGFYIKNGEIAYPVNEITIASNLKTMFKHLIPANDLKFESSINSPSLLIERMTIGGI